MAGALNQRTFRSPGKEDNKSECPNLAYVIVRMIGKRIDEISWCGRVFGFTDFITKKLIRFLYMAAVLFAGLGALSFIIKGFSEGAMMGAVALVLSPVVFLFWVTMTRTSLELMMVVFRISDYARIVADATEGGASSNVQQAQSASTTLEPL